MGTIKRREFIRTAAFACPPKKNSMAVILSAVLVLAAAAPQAAAAPGPGFYPGPSTAEPDPRARPGAPAAAPSDWPMLMHYDQAHIAQIALPIGGIGTGTISLGGRGDLRDWEIMNRPAKGFAPGAPFFAVRVKPASGPAKVRALQGPVELYQYEGPSGVKNATNPNLPTFSRASFDGSYPFGIVNLSDQVMPVTVRIKGWNPLIPTDADASGIPIAVLTYEIANRTG